jgi:hypothetical protein
MQRSTTRDLATTITRRKNAISAARIRSAFLAIAVLRLSVHDWMISDGGDNFASWNGGFYLLRRDVESAGKCGSPRPIFSLKLSLGEAYQIRVI